MVSESTEAQIREPTMKIPVPQLGGASDGRAADRAEVVGFESLHGVQSVDQP